MRAAFVTDVEHVEIREIDRPKIGDTEVLIKAHTVGICGSDLHLFRGTHPFRKAPAILGHEIAGEIVEIGSKVTKYSIGDRVTVEPQVGCGRCEMCRAGRVNLCAAKKVPGTPQWIGAFAEYFNAEERVVYKLADSVPFELGTLAEPLAVAIHAVNRAETKRGSLAILGAGTIGQLILAVAQRRGSGPIFVSDTAPFNRSFALKHGAAAALDPMSDDVAAEIKHATGGVGADLCIVAAGADDILDTACGCVRRGGEVGLVSMITKKIPFYCYSAVFNELRMYGAMTYETRDLAEAVEMINGGADLGSYVTHIMDGLDETQRGLDILSQKKEDVVKIVIRV